MGPLVIPTPYYCGGMVSMYQGWTVRVARWPGASKTPHRASNYNDPLARYGIACHKWRSCSLAAVRERLLNDLNVSLANQELTWCLICFRFFSGKKITLLMLLKFSSFFSKVLLDIFRQVMFNICLTHMSSGRIWLVFKVFLVSDNIGRRNKCRKC